MAHSPSNTPPAVVALIIAILGAAWNQQGVGTNNELRDKTRPVVGVVVRSEQNVRTAEADAIARRLCMMNPTADSNPQALSGRERSITGHVWHVGLTSCVLLAVPV